MYTVNDIFHRNNGLCYGHGVHGYIDVCNNYANDTVLHLLRLCFFVLCSSNLIVHKT